MFVQPGVILTIILQVGLLDIVFWLIRRMANLVDTKATGVEIMPIT